jgi:hypothetical protein
LAGLTPAPSSATPEFPATELTLANLYDLERVVTFDAAVITSGFLTYLMGCGVASNDSNKVCHLQKRMMLTEAAGDAELVLGNCREFGHSA